MCICEIDERAFMRMRYARMHGLVCGMSVRFSNFRSKGACDLSGAQPPVALQENQSVMKSRYACVNFNRVS